MGNYIPQKLYNQILKNMPIICVDVVILNSNDEVLLIKRNQPPAKDQWWIPGGRLHKGESLIDCAKRKALEEVGLDCQVGYELLHRDRETVFNDGPNGISVHSVNFVFKLWVRKDQKVILDDTMSEYKWVSSIPESCHPYIIRCLNMVGLK